ncbi:hypothetical protein WSM22_24670 [Cytophagales bacterium WSM2-2]|nr:hypothetical protein WSM22_24670 [Cytophagales bacterium WSM2-2]
MHKAVVILTLVSGTLYAQIGAKVQSKIFGVWQNSQPGYQMTLILKEDNTGEFDGEAIQFFISTNKLAITQAGETTNYTFVQQNNSLTLSGGDIDGSIIFTRNGAGNEKTVAQNAGPVTKTSKASDIIGLWSGGNENIEFKTDGTCNYLGQTYQYQTSPGNVTLITSQGNLMMGYSVANSQLTLTANGRQLVYSKGNSNVDSTNNSGKGNVAQELVGKWCYINVNSTNSGGSSSTKCITLNANGSYEYYGESSRSVNTSDLSGGTASQSSDRGTWWVQGDRIYYNSQSSGQGSYQLQKQNHPKNGDPMIILDGQTYVTYYNKPPGTRIKT